ncbi:MAG: GNAT family N-acetyltransferase [Ignavibacteriae bacterium]|nr:GNAT family N-acetyltransferase [Ignavibacteriota bacterium]
MGDIKRILPIHRTINETEVELRLLQPGDSFAEMTEMLHISYKQLADMGLRFLATYQDEKITRDRALTNGLCIVAISGGKIIGTIAVSYPGWTKGTAFYEQSHVAHFGQFAVLPEYQKSGLGSLLLDIAEQLAFTALGATEMALDTSEQAHHLLEYYSKRGYRFIEYVQWDLTNYLSKTLSKSIEDFRK